MAGTQVDGLLYDDPADPVRGLGRQKLEIEVQFLGFDMQFGQVAMANVRAFAEFLATPEGLEGWIKTVGVLSPNVKVPAEWYAGNYKLKVANDIASAATSINFDASDLMPPSVGQGSFWTGISDWANNNGSNTDAVLKAIDDSWPSS